MQSYDVAAGDAKRLYRGTVDCLEAVGATFRKSIIRRRDSLLQ